MTAGDPPLGLPDLPTDFLEGAILRLRTQEIVTPIASSPFSPAPSRILLAESRIL